MSQEEITEHAGYLTDTVKLRAYEVALRQVVGPESVVLDLGAGTGILGLLAARAGARHVYSVDSGSIIDTAEAIARASGLAERMTFIRSASSRVRLPEPVDVAVCDQIGGMAYDAGVLDYFADARSRLLGAGAVLVPGSFELLAAPVASKRWHDTVGLWARRPAGFDLGPMFERAINTVFRVDLPPAEFLGPAVPWAQVSADHVEPITGEVELAVDRAGEINGIAGMFRATLTPGVELSNDPFHAAFFKRWQNLHPLPAPVAVEPGDCVRVRFDVRPRSYLATWTVEIERGGRSRVSTNRGSTILGLFLTPTDLTTTGGSAVARESAAVVADRFILSLVDGRRTVAEIIDAAWPVHGEAFASREDLKQRVESLLWSHVQPEPPWLTSPTA